ncbi:hypothetical protein GIB67_020884 [Kingdonia uniflora]|uniref:CCHC-type domain-containing protein n=1 Tax=Kingdonia uniflora TaxID=39325 RepID=A0A7J7M7D2_9MAGN|nr:hypothetical protein GIB67_020884 [Kingdonia uniflora]
MLDTTESVPARATGVQQSDRPLLGPGQCLNYGEMGHTKNVCPKLDRGPQPLRQFQGSTSHQPRPLQFQQRQVVQGPPGGQRQIAQGFQGDQRQIIPVPVIGFSGVLADLGNVVEGGWSCSLIAELVCVWIRVA